MAKETKVTKTQVNKVIRVIEKDATGTGYLFTPGVGRNDHQNGFGEYCVIGGLLLASGAKPSDMAWTHLPDTADRNRLERTYGIPWGSLESLIAVNDKYKTVEARRRALIRAVTKFIGTRGMPR